MENSIKTIKLKPNFYSKFLLKELNKSNFNIKFKVKFNF